MTAGRAEAGPERPDGFSLALNFLPLGLILAGLAVAGLLAESRVGRTGCFIAWLYLAPPLAGRLVIAALGRPEGTFGMGERGYRAWWAMTQLQMIFNRLPVLDEALRLVPGLYPLWIRLWGGSVSPFALVGPGVVITDRHLVRVGRGALLGAQARIAGHMALRDDAGRWQVVVAAPVVEADAIMGGESGLGPGARLRGGALLPAGRRVAPFAVWPRSSGETA